MSCQDRVRRKRPRPTREWDQSPQAAFCGWSQRRLIMVIAMGCLASLLGCLSQRTTSRSIHLDQPRTTTGVLTTEATDEGLAQLQAALDAMRIDELSDALAGELHIDSANLAPPQSNQPDPSSNDPANTQQTGSPTTSNSDQRIEPSTGASAPPSPQTYPANAGKLIPLSKMSMNEIRELIEFIVIRFQTEQGYVEASGEEAGILPPAPAGVAIGTTLARQESNGTQRLLRFGFRTFTSQLPHLWVYGLTVGSDHSLAVNPDLEQVQPVIDAALAEIGQLRQAISGADLDRKIVQLSYIDAQNAVKTLKALGVNVQPNIDAIPASFSFDQLPMVVPLPSPDEKEVAIVGEKSSGRGSFGLSMSPTEAGNLYHEVNASPTSQLLILFHPGHPEQFNEVDNLLQQYVDQPARQIFVEGMVLEISEDGLEDLGIEWEYMDGSFEWVLGSLSAGGVFDTLAGEFIDTRDLRAQWDIRLRALIREGKAEILSRPSVLTLDGRQAAIRVGEDIPIATSQEGFSGSSNKIAFSFNYLPVGILLNVRPRMSRNEREVSMLIDATVSATVPGRDLEIRSTDGDLLASAPTISTRRVQTYGRIRNSTPFIIGGLVSRDRTVTRDKVPILGDLPLIGYAFRAESTRDTKREVIIVLTPYVLPEDTPINPGLPKGDDYFDSTNTNLFRDAYRIRAEDVFDLRFLTEHRGLLRYKALAERVLDSNYRMAAVPPFDEFVNGRIPGEDILVHRMIYEVIKRTKVDHRINPDRVIYFKPQEIEGYSVQFLSHLLARLGDGVDADSFFKRNTGKAVVLTYTRDRDSMDISKLATEPMPEFTLIDCPNRDTWQKILWEYNQPDEKGQQRYSIVIQDQRDIERLQRAIMLKRIVELNGGASALSLNNFTVGKLLLIPELDPDQVTVLDSDVARYFFHTELYYGAAIQKIEQTLRALDEALRRPEIQTYLNGAELPEPNDESDHADDMKSPGQPTGNP